MGEATMAGQRREYGQYCGLAAAMDVVGERWTLLIVRELLLGPRRYNELLDDLPGIGTNLLADRLKMLTELGVIRQRPARGKTKVYEMTPFGEELRTPVLQLARWGMGYLGDPPAGAVTRPRWGFLAVQALIDPARVGSVDEAYEFRVDGEVFHISVRDGSAAAASGPAEDPSMVATTDTATFIRIGSGRLTPFEAVASGLLTLTGDYAAVMRCSTLLGLVGSEIAVSA
jgi:DNA-binding HxlR family transcriptional regulator